mgnify:CR=1 FL=1|tara:strand:+ start:1136 stop:1630 length:495 start_codon:yes stop_codon:yes gene_type:complete
MNILKVDKINSLDKLDVIGKRDLVDKTKFSNNEVINKACKIVMMDIRKGLKFPMGVIHKIENSALASYEMLLDEKDFLELKEILDYQEVLKGSRVKTQDTPEMTKLRLEFEVWKEKMYKMGLIDKNISTSHKVTYEVIDGLDVERVISLNLGRKYKEPKDEPKK